MILLGDFDDPNIWPLRSLSLFPNSDDEHPILHKTFNLLSPCIVGQLEPAHEVAIFSAYLKHPVIIDENQNFIPGDPRKVGFVDMGPWGFYTVELGPQGRENFRGETRETGGKKGRERERERSGEWVQNLQVVEWIP